MKESQSIVTILVNGHAILRLLCNIQVHKKLNSDILLFQELHFLIFIGFLMWQIPLEILYIIYMNLSNLSIYNLGAERSE